MADDALEMKFTLTGLREVLKGYDSVGKSQKKAEQDERRAVARRKQAGNTARREAVLDTRQSQQKQKASGKAVQAENNALRKSAVSAKNTGRSLLAGIGKAADQRAKSTPKQPASLSQRLMGVLASSRFSMGGEGGGHLMPLVGKTLGAITGGAEGMEAAAGPIGLVIALGAAAVHATKALFEMTERASEASAALYRVSLLSGGTGRETGELSALARSVGGSPGDIAGIASGLHSEITDGGFGQAAGLRLGISDAPGPFGKVDQSSALLHAMSQLRQMAPDDQTRTLRALPSLQPLAGTLAQSQGQFNKEQGDSGLNAKVFNPKFAQQSADFQGAIGRVEDALGRLWAALSPVVIKQFTNLTNEFADGLNSLATWAADHQSDIRLFLEATTGIVGGLMKLAESGSDLHKFVEGIEAFWDLTHGLIGAGIQHIQNIVNGKGGESDALNRNTRATEDNTRAMVQPGTYGKVNREGSLPTGFGGTALQKADLHQLRLSAF